MANLTSQLAVRLIDGVTAPARGAAKSIREIGRAAKSVDGTRVATNRLGDAARGVVARAAGIGAGFIGIGALANGAKAAVLNYADLERKMLRVGITADATGEEIAKATATLRDLSNIKGMPGMDALVEGVDAIVSQGGSLSSAMDRIQAIAITAAASGASVEDMAKSAGALGANFDISAAQMQKAFDVLNAGGKAGQFELRDMARYLPSLAAQAKIFGLHGEEGLRTFVAMSQIIRKVSGTSEEAATAMSDFFGKATSQETMGKFKNFGVNIGDVMDKARKGGKDLLETYLDAIEAATKGDENRLNLLFSDKEIRRAVTGMILARNELRKLRGDLTKVDGSTQADFRRQADDTTASINRMSAAWDSLLNTLGKKLAPGAATAMEEVAKIVTQPGSEEPNLSRNRKGPVVDPKPGSTNRSEGGREAQAQGYVNPMASRAQAHRDYIDAQNAEGILDRNLPNRTGTVGGDVNERLGYRRFTALRTGELTPDQSMRREDDLTARIRAEAVSMAQQMARAQSDAQKQAISDAFSGILTKLTTELYSLQTARSGQPMVSDERILATVKHVKELAVQGFGVLGAEAMSDFGAGMTAQGVAVESAAKGVMDRVKRIMEAPITPNLTLPQMTVPAHGRGGSPAILPSTPVGPQSNTAKGRGNVQVTHNTTFNVHGQTDPKRFAADVREQTNADTRRALRGIQSDVGPDFG